MTQPEIAVETVVEESKNESTPDPVVVETVDDDPLNKSTPDPVVVESKTGPVDRTKSKV